VHRLLLSLLLAGVAFLPASLQAQAPDEPLRIHFFDVGQGDAALIEVPTGQRVLIDAGPGREIVEHLRRLAVDTIDLFVASHNHADHIGGAAAVLRAFPVRFFMDNAVPHTTRTYRRLLEVLHEVDVPLLEPERRTITLGDSALEILPPPGDPALDQNDNSVGVVLRFGKFRATFAGDAQRVLWRHWLETLPEAIARVHVHKASHHGSRNGDISAALERLRPRLVVVSAGWGNQYGHPHAQALARYAVVEAEVRLTGTDGTVEVSAERDGSFRVATEREAAPATSRGELRIACGPERPTISIIPCLAGSRCCWSGW
jgi:competence protein ComEC